MSGTTTNLGLPYATLGDGADMESFGVKQFAVALDALFPLSSARLHPSSGIQSSSTPQTGVGTSFTDVTGSSFSITPTVAGVLLVEGFVVMSGSAGGSAGASLALNVDGADQAFVPTLLPTTQVLGALPGLWRVSLSAAAHTIKLRAKSNIAGTIDIAHFALKYLLHS